METLELKHLAPYLPYRLRFRDSYAGDVSTYTLNSSNLSHFENGHIKVFLPILRPLSDLTKEIEVNGKNFVPAEILFSVENDELQDFEDFGKIPEYWQDAIKIKPKWYDYYQVEFLFEWHFDVFGLIEKGLAIDYNTLNK